MSSDFDGYLPLRRAREAEQRAVPTLAKLVGLTAYVMGLRLARVLVQAPERLARRL